nr:CoA-binding protein [Lysobacter sp. M2-1]
MRRIAVLGIKPESRAGQPAHMIPAYLLRHGYEVIPVPVYYPEVTEILGRPVFRSLRDVPGRIDLVDVFRKPQDIAPHLDEIIAARPRAVWFQTGIRHDDCAQALREAGIDVVQDECLMVEHRRWRSGH